MKLLITIGLIFISLIANCQIKSKQHINNSESLAAMTVIVGTFTTIHFMNTPPEYYNNSHLMDLRYKQRATVAVTGIATTVITYFVVKKIKHKVRRNKNIYKWQ